MKRAFAVAGLLLLAAVVTVAGQRAETVIKTFRLNPTEMAVSCKNGADPTIVPNTGHQLLIVSCGK